MISRTFQITLPSIEWKRLYSWKTLCALLVLCAAAFGVYWWQAIRPFVLIRGGTLQVMKRDLLSEGDGLISEFVRDDFFQLGQALFSTKDPQLMAEQTQLMQKLQAQKKEMGSLQAKFDQNMQQYVYLQNELAEIGPTQLSEEILNEMQSLQTSIDRLEAEAVNLEEAKAALEHTLSGQVAVAPFDGIVLARFKQLGERAKKGEPLLQICDKQSRWVEAEIDEALLSRVRVGLPARLEFPLYPKQQWMGQVAWISPVIEAGKVKIRLTADLLPLRPGLSAKTYIKIH